MTPYFSVQIKLNRKNFLENSLFEAANKIRLKRTIVALKVESSWIRKSTMILELWNNCGTFNRRINYIDDAMLEIGQHFK